MSVPESALIAAIGVLVVFLLWATGPRPETLAAASSLPESETSRPGEIIPHQYKWSRDSERFAAAQIAYADAHVREPGGGLPRDCVFKINHEVYDPASTRDDHLTLVIEAKMHLTRDRIPESGEFYTLAIVPLRGTDVWRIIRKFSTCLGEPSSMVLGADVAGGDLVTPMDSPVSSVALMIYWLVAAKEPALTEPRE